MQITTRMSSQQNPSTTHMSQVAQLLAICLSSHPSPTATLTAKIWACHAPTEAEIQALLPHSKPSTAIQLPAFTYLWQRAESRFELGMLTVLSKKAFPGWKMGGKRSNKRLKSVNPSSQTKPQSADQHISSFCPARVSAASLSVAGEKQQRKEKD